MTYLTKPSILSFIVVLTLSTFVGAENSTSGRVVVRGDHGMIDLSFNDHDRELIREHYGQKFRHKHLPPGLAKKGKLPPGHKKRFARHDHLPPHLAYQRATYHRLPRELERRLSRLPDGYLRITIGGSILLFNERTRLILDVIHDID